MTSYLYVSADGSSGQDRAALLGCGWVPELPAQFVSTATALPCVLLAYQGTVVTLADDKSQVTPAQVTTAAAPLAAAEQAATAAAATLTTNQATLQGKAQAALAANATFLAIASPTQAQAVAQVQLLTKEVNALIRLALGLFDSTAGT